MTTIGKASYSYSRGWYAVVDAKGAYVCHVATEAQAKAKLAELDAKQGS